MNRMAGPDNITAEHLKYTIDVEQVLICLKQGITIPIYKGGGKDVNSYRGITLNSVISKILESLSLDRLESLFMEAGLPYPNKSAYRKGVSCADVIFATQEVINRYLQEGSKVYMCLYELQKGFHSVEFPVLLKRLFDVGVSSKT